MKIFDHNDAFIAVDVRIDAQILFTPDATDPRDHLRNKLLKLIPGTQSLPQSFVMSDVNAAVAPSP